MKFKRGHIYPGLFICSEGPDGSGKTTQFGRKNEYLKNLGYEVVEVREPGGTFIGEKIRKILSADRFVWSTEAYQGYGAGMSLKNIKKVESAVLDKVYPDLTIVYDVDTDTALKRMSPILRGENLDRIESKGVELQKKVIFTLEELLVKTGLNKTLTRKSITSKA